MKREDLKVGMKVYTKHNRYEIEAEITKIGRKYAHTQIEI